MECCNIKTTGHVLKQTSQSQKSLLHTSKVQKKKEKKSAFKHHQHHHHHNRQHRHQQLNL